MSFKDKIVYYENMGDTNEYIEVIGSVPIILTAPHTMEQVRDDGEIKLKEPYTKAIALYLAYELKTYALVKTKDTGVESNSDEADFFKNRLINIVKENNILLAIDIHGASKERNFDVELGTINNLSASFSTIQELKEAFEENGIKNIKINDPFKGGGITRALFGMTDIDAIQIEIHADYRNIENIDNIFKICDSLKQFVLQYHNITKRKD